MKEKNNNLKQIRKERGLTVKEVVDGTGIPMRTYQNYEYMEREIGAGALQKLADFYNVTTDYLLGRPEAKQPEDALERIFSEKSFAEIEEELLCSYLQLPHDARMAVVQFLNNVAEKVTPANKTEKVVMLSIKKSRYRTSAGTGYDLNDSDAWERVNVMDCPEARNADFIIEVDGDSMQPTFYNGENVFVKATPDVEIGKIGIFVVNGKGYIKELGGDCLISHNEKYNPIPLKNTENQCIGKVLGVAELVEE